MRLELNLQVFQPFQPEVVSEPLQCKVYIFNGSERLAPYPLPTPTPLSGTTLDTRNRQGSFRELVTNYLNRPQSMPALTGNQYVRKLRVSG